MLIWDVQTTGTWTWLGSESDLIKLMKYYDELFDAEIEYGGMMPPHLCVKKVPFPMEQISKLF